jgi:hypothetical protein
MITVTARAVSAQTLTRFLSKALLSAALVAAAALFGKEGLALSLLVIFSGVTGPALRIVTLRMSGILDRVTVSPVNKPSAALFYTAVWSAMVCLALVPAIVIAVYLLGPALLVRFGIGGILAVTVGTLSGIAAKTLGDAHLYAVLAAVPLILATLIPYSPASILPYASLSANTVSLGSSVVQTGFLVALLMILAGVASRM